jgi:hypothetical protein
VRSKFGSRQSVDRSSWGIVNGLRTTLKTWLPWIVVALLGLGPILVCGLIGPLEMGTELGQKAAPDWSRAVRVGMEFYGTDGGAPLVVDGEQRVHLVWALRRSAREFDIRYLRLDHQGLVEEEHDLGLSLFQPRKVQLVLGTDAQIHGFLLASSEAGASSGVYHFTLTESGDLSGGPTLLSSGTNPSFEYDVAVSSSGLLHVFWTEGAQAERDMYYSALPPDSQLWDPSRVVIRGVTSPVAAVGPEDTLHVFWEQLGANEDTAELYHETAEGLVPGSLSGRKLLDLPTGKRFFRTGPVVAFDREYAYLLWTVDYRRDITQEAISEGWYSSFRLDSESAVSPRSLRLPMEEQPTYQTYDSPFSYEYLVSSRGDVESGSLRVTSPSALAGHQEAIVTWGMTIWRGVSPEHQIANLVFGGGELSGYQVASNTIHWSRLSNLVADQDGDLHLSWVEGLEPGPGDVFYATTTQVVRDRVDGFTSEDLLFAALNTVFGAVAGVPAIPLAIAWILPAFAWAWVAGRFVGRPGARRMMWYAALIITVVIYQGGKLYFSPQLLEYVPFSASIPFLPEALYTPLRVLTPVCIAGLATIGAALAVLRSGTRSLLTVGLVFILIDALLTVLIYGSGLAVL